MRRALKSWLLPLVWLTAVVVCVLLWLDAHPSSSVPALVEESRVTVRSLHPGRITELYASPGAPVAAGQIIARLDVGLLDDRIDALERRAAELERVIAEARERDRAETARVAQADQRDLITLRRNAWRDMADLRAAQAELDGVSIEIRRIEGAVQAGALAQQQLQTLLTRRDTLQAFIAEQRRAATLPAGLDPAALPHAGGVVDPALLRELYALQSELEALRQEREERTLRAPVSGVVVAVMARAGDTAEPLLPLFVLEAEPPRFVELYLPGDSPHVPRPGDRIELTSPRAGDVTAATVVFTAPGFAQLPERLQPPRGPLAWGRVVRAQLPSDHHLLSGEQLTAHLR